MTALRANKLFGEMVAAELHALEQTAQIKTYTAGREIFREGERGDGLYAIIEGKVAITKVIPRDQRCVLARLGPGDFFGEMEMVDDQPRTATATADENTKAYFILREDLWKILRHRPELVVGLLRESSARMNDFSQRYIEEVLQAERFTLVGRLAHTLARQFNNPLNIVMDAAEKAAAGTAQMRASARDLTRKQVDRMNNLINEFLEFTCRSSSTTVLARANYADFVRPLIEEIRSELVDRAVTVELENEPPEVSVLADPARLSRLFQNLVYNACVAMPDGGRIKFRFGWKENEVVTQIEDTGKGIPSELANRLFEPFGTFAKTPGMGLELAICRRIIEDHHGRIRARSNSGGTTFIFNLPLARIRPSSRAV